MKRLREETGSADAAGTLQTALLASVAPLEPSTERMERVYAALARPGRRARPPLLRPAIVVVLMIGLAAAAAATLGRVLLRRVAGPEAGRPAAGRGSASAAPGRGQVAVPAWPSEIGPAAGVAARPEAAPAVPVAAPPERPPRRERARRAEPAEVAPVAPPVLETQAAADSPETAMVVEALRALRRDGDPVRAGKLLEQYLALHSEGAVVEEALVLAIEAAVARDDPSAAALAERYLERYPAGRFREAAASALRRSETEEAEESPDR